MQHVARGYKTVGLYWVKLNKTADPISLGNGPLYSERDFFTGLGFWTRANPRALPARHPRPSQAPRGRRAQAPDRAPARALAQPDAAYDRIERLVPGPYLELFARRSRPGWDGWGDQPGLFDRGPVLTRRRPSRISEARAPRLDLDEPS